jgi:hypothetical protein
MAPAPITIATLPFSRFDIAFAPGRLLLMGLVL